MTNAYDIVTIGGGLAGASLARAMTEGGARVLVLERETRFKDRVRGEALFPWGAAELERLGLRSLMLSTCAIENRWWDDFLGPDQIGHRDTVTETPGRTATLTFYHPEMQETLLRSAAEAGAEIRRGVRATGMSPGRPPKVTFEQNRRAKTIAASLIVGADGRDSIVRRWASFASRQDPPRLRIAGVLFEGMTALPQDTTHMVINPKLGQSSILIPQGSGRVRAYVIFPSRGDRRLSGERDIPRFVEEAIRTGVRPELLEGAHGAGPLATFEGAGSWVEQPYRDFVALIGDAAATSDPSWGQGLSLAVRDVRLLRDALLANDDWEVAGRAYAADHDRGYATIHTTEDLFTTFFLETGPEADARRARALPLIAEEPDRVPDAFMAGPDAAPTDESARNRFFGETQPLRRRRPEIAVESGRSALPDSRSKYEEEYVETHEVDVARAEEFAGKMVGVLNGAMLALMTSIGHQTRLFDAMADLPPSTSEEIAAAANLNERYVREWLGAMVVGGIAHYDPDGKTYRLPPEHAACLTRAAGPDNLASLAQFVPLLSNVEDGIVESFRKGGGVPYSAYARFQELMAEDSAQVYGATLIETTLPLVPGLVERLESGIAVADIGCGQGIALSLMAQAFPNSRFVGYDLSEEGIASARAEAERIGLENARFEVRDVTTFDGREHYQLITAFDVIHDLARPAEVLRHIFDALGLGGTFLMVDIAASSHLHENVEHPLGPFLYAVSTMHCMTVSLEQGGVGLGTVWGEQKARQMLADAGFGEVEVEQVEGDILNNYYIARKG